jgi:hypothetical protein
MGLAARAKFCRHELSRRAGKSGIEGRIGAQQKPNESDELSSSRNRKGGNQTATSPWGGFAMRAMRPATRALGYREEDFRVDGGTDPDVPEVWSDVDAPLITNSRHLTERVGRLAALIDRNVVEQSKVCCD